VSFLFFVLYRSYPCYFFFFLLYSRISMFKVFLL